MTHNQQISLLLEGTSFGDASLYESMKSEFSEKIKTGRSLSVYCGYDPTSTSLHLGHLLTLLKLRQFAEFGHNTLLLLGTFTACIGDTSDKTTGRKSVTPDAARNNAQAFLLQVERFLDESTHRRWNSDWLAKLPLSDFLGAASKFTVQQFLARRSYAQRFDKGDPIGLHELMYAVLQGLDAVELRADVQLGGEDQLFNIMAGRRLQEAAGLRPCTPLFMPIVVGTDGVKKMSKSENNTILLDTPPNEMFEQVMSVSDDTAKQWAQVFFPHVFRKQEFETEPMKAKMELAFGIVAKCHQNDTVAMDAFHAFERVHRNREVPQDVPTMSLEGPRKVTELLVESGLASSKGEARRLIEQGGVRMDGVPITPNLVDWSVNVSCLLQVGRRKFVRIQREGAA